MPVEEWRRFQLLMMKFGADTQREPDYLVLRNRRAVTLHKQRVLRFKCAVENTTVSRSEEPCECGRNHYVITIGDQRRICPVRFWLNMCQVKRLAGGTEAMFEWKDEHPISLYLHRIDESKDATYEEEE